MTDISEGNFQDNPLTENFWDINRVLGVDSVEELDPGNEFTRVSVLIERRYARLDSPWTWFWMAGVGFASIDVGANAVGTTPGGQGYRSGR
jgi:hypothetical protein